MKLSVRRIAVLGVLGAILVVAQVALAFIPNVEMVSLLIIIYALVFGHQTFAPVAIFVIIEGLIYGFGLWWFTYLYTWPLLVVLTLIFRRYNSTALFVILSGAFGLLFGALCSLIYLFIGTPSAALAFWTSGLLFDVIHCAGNTAVALTLFTPMKKLITKLERYC